MGGADGAGSDGACKAGEPVKEWALAATFAKDGQSMKVDFSPKGGPKDVTGTWNGNDGITWAKLESTNLDTKAYPSKAERSTDLGKGGWSVDRLTKRMGASTEGWPEPEREKKEQKGRGLPAHPEKHPTILRS